MEISDELISHLESLAHIELDTDEREDCRRDFEGDTYPLKIPVGCRIGLSVFKP